jgi:hypothetical protein
MLYHFHLTYLILKSSGAQLGYRDAEWPEYRFSCASIFAILSVSYADQIIASLRNEFR